MDHISRIRVGLVLYFEIERAYSCAKYSSFQLVHHMSFLYSLYSTDVLWNKYEQNVVKDNTYFTTILQDLQIEYGVDINSIAGIKELYLKHFNTIFGCYKVYNFAAGIPQNFEF